jgi:2'-5' RNA ligase
MRAFLALPLPERLRAAAAAARGFLAASAEGWRFVGDESLHITMRFLGEVEPSRRDTLDASLRAALIGSRPLNLRLRGAAVAPTAARPRVLWLCVIDESSDGALLELGRRLESTARTLGFPPEERPFAAHVTLARARRVGRPSIPLVAAIGDLGVFAADRLILYRSELARGGSRYHEEASYPLGGGPR